MEAGLPKGESSGRNSTQGDCGSSSTDITESDCESESDNSTSFVRSMKVLGVADIGEEDVHLARGLRRNVSLTLGGGLSGSLSESVAESLAAATAVAAVVQLLRDLLRFWPHDGSIVLLCNILVLFFSRTSFPETPTLPFSP
jgi:hypothetical protein